MRVKQEETSAHATTLANGLHAACTPLLVDLHTCEFGSSVAKLDLVVRKGSELT